MRWCLFAAYPVLTHCSVLEQRPGLQWAGVMGLAGGALYGPLARRAGGAWLACAALGAGYAWLLASGAGRWTLYLPSVTVPALVLCAFAASLRPGRTPLVTRIAAAAHDPLPAALLAYTRAVTWLWTLVLAALLGTELWLACAGDARRWSAFANLGVYALLAAVFVAEYAWRRWRFRGLPQPGFLASLRLTLQRRPMLGDAFAEKQEAAR
jgi:uncharacterized membrane protein